MPIKKAAYVIIAGITVVCFSDCFAASNKFAGTNESISEQSVGNRTGGLQYEKCDNHRSKFRTWL